MDQEFLSEVKDWIATDPDPKTAAQLQEWLDSGNEEALRQCFQGFLQFGTAGLRGPIGPGPSCMNRAVVHRASAGIAMYMKARGLTKVVIGRDARHGSEDFTDESAQVFAGAGMEVYVLPRPLPTPVLAFAVNYLKADVGVMVTASHNPPQDNGYKVYLGGTVDGVRYAGSQIVPPADTEIAADIATITSLQPRERKWIVLDDEVFNAYVRATGSIARSHDQLKVVYSAMHGIGTETLLEVFKAAGFNEPILVKEQALPDPDFPTVQFPNPEEPGAIDLSIALAQKEGADIVIANDPDADRCAAAIHDPRTGWRMLSGDEIGVILGHYIATRFRSTCDGKAFGNSIVSSSALGKIAKKHGIEFHETLTGFKWLAKIPNLRFGYEEAIGYAVDALSVNDKDGISAALALRQCAAELKAEGRTVADFLDEIWSTYGYHSTLQISIRVPNISMVDGVLARLRAAQPKVLAGNTLTRFIDLAKPAAGLPATNGITLWYGESIRIIVRPSGTEAKLKCYIEVSGPYTEVENVKATVSQLKTELAELLKV